MKTQKIIALVNYVKQTNIYNRDQQIKVIVHRLGDSACDLIDDILTNKNNIYYVNDSESLKLININLTKLKDYVSQVDSNVGKVLEKVNID